MDILKFIVFVVILVLAGWTVQHFHVLKHLKLIRGWIQANGFEGLALFAGVFGLAFSFGVPAIALAIFAGSTFGTFTGLVACSVGAFIGILITFLLSRFLARDIVDDILGKNPTFIKIDALTEKYGWYMVAIIRFIPFIPPELTNYGFGLTKIKFLPYMFWSWLCMLPWLFIYIAGTDAYLDFKADQTIPWSLLAPTLIMLALLLFAGFRFMKLIEPELKKKTK